MKLDDIKQQPKPVTPPVNNMTEQELRIFLAQNKTTILEYVKQVDKEHDALRTKFERDGFEKSLLAAQANIDQMIKYSEQALAAVRQEVAAVDEKAKTAMNYIGEQANRLQTSNEAVKEVLKAEGSRLTATSREVVVNLGNDAADGVKKAVNTLDKDLKEVVQVHQQIAATVRTMYAYKGFWTLGLWVWRWAIFMMLVLICQRALGINGIMSWIKVWTGWAIL